jgi:hypothetical protein
MYADGSCAIVSLVSESCRAGSNQSPMKVTFLPITQCVRRASFCPETDRCSGFALVIALTLMAFILLLLVSLTSFIRVESQVSASQLRILESRQNALLGLQLAVGELQIAAGPDQRATGTGELVDGTDATKQQFTVVWDGTQPNMADPVSWLVSRSDPDVAFAAADPTDASWPQLVSERIDPAGITFQAVRAEPLLIYAGDRQAGRLAWWVGDEGVKARFNLAEPEEIYNSAEQGDRLRVAGRWGIESLDAVGLNYKYDDPAFRASLRRITSREQFALLDASFEAVNSGNFHNVTALSRSLLTDAKNGGLKKDLSYILDRGPNSPTGAIIDGTPYSAQLDSQYDSVTWEQMASFNGIAAEAASGGSVSSRVQDSDQYGVAPVLTMLNLHFGITLRNIYRASPRPGAKPPWQVFQTPTLAEDSQDRFYKIHHRIRPFFVLANPYNVPISARDYRIRFDLDGPMNIELRVDEGPNQGQLVGYDPNMETVFDNMVFVVENIELEPGQAKAYFLDYNPNPSYDYNFQQGEAVGSIDTEGDYYSYFTYFNTPVQQYLFVGTDIEEGILFDSGLATIRINTGNLGELTGDIIEVTDSSMPLTWNGETQQRIAALAWEFSNTANLTVRTSITDGAGGNERVVQHIGPSLCGRAELQTHLGYWPVNLDWLPRTSSEFNGIYHPSKWAFEESRENALGTWLKARMTPGASSILLNLFSASNADSSGGFVFNNTFPSWDGWATDSSLRGKRFAGLKEDSSGNNWAKGLYRLAADGAGAWQYSALTAVGNEGNFDITGYGFPWGAGVSYEGAVTTGLPRQGMFFDLPREVTQTDPLTGAQSTVSSLSSIGQLQHFDASGYTTWNIGDAPASSIADSALAYTPSFAIGSSYASPFVERDRLSNRTDDNLQLVDWAYILNDILFDGYFFSGYEPSTGGNPSVLQNGRMVRLNEMTDLSALEERPTAAAEVLAVDGGFNVNSTSVEAWYALLNAFRGVAFGDLDGADTRGVFPRTLYQDAASVETVSLDPSDIEDAWKGWRHVTDAASASQLYELAEAIVDEVKARGPFLSMSDFVNRRLVAASDSLAHQGLSGPLQAALDRVVNVDVAGIPEYRIDPLKADRHYLYNVGSGTSLKAHLGTGAIYESDGSPVAGAGASSTGSIAGWVLQGDLLQSLAPVLSSRSDTFRIRSYGSSQDPVSGEVVSESYVEAIVQRMPDYVDSSLAADETPTPGTTNARAGRKFEIVGYRFLEPSEI